MQRIKAVVVKSKISMAHGENRRRTEKNNGGTAITLPLTQTTGPIKQRDTWSAGGNDERRPERKEKRKRKRKEEDEDEETSTDAILVP